MTVGYLGKPTVVDNVETLAQATEIALHGGRMFAGRGTKHSAGTKILSVSGDCARPGLYEYPFGVRVEQVLEGLRRERRRRGAGQRPVGRMPHARRIPAGTSPSKTCRPPAHSWSSAWSATCSRWRAISPISSPTRAAASARPAASAPRSLRDALDKIAEGRGSRYEINELMRLAELLRRTSHCGLGQTAGNPVRDAWAKFRPLSSGV